MAFVVMPSRNKIVQAAFAGLEAARRAEKKAASAPEGSFPKEAVVTSEPYRRLVATMPCKRCHVQGFSQAAHPPCTGKAIKQDDRLCVPLCTTRAGPNGAIEGCHPKADNYKLGDHAATMKLFDAWGIETRAEIRAADAWPKKLPLWEEKKPLVKARRARAAIKKGAAV